MIHGRMGFNSKFYRESDTVGAGLCGSNMAVTNQPKIIERFIISSLAKVEAHWLPSE